MAISPGSTLVDYLIPAREARSVNLLRDFLLIVGFSILLALCAQVSFHILLLTPVPITLQTLGVLLTGAALGSRRGALAMLAYLAEGAAGLPVFEGGTAGFVHLIGVTGGYLWAFPIAAYVTGLLCERRLDRSFLTSALVMLPGSLIIYALGVPWLAIVLHLSLPVAIAQGMLPFIPGDLFKLLIAAVLLPTTWKVLRLAKPGMEQPKSQE